MKANELRLGNYLTDRIHRTILVSEIRPEHLVFYLSNGTKMKHHINTFSPIPLTEKWLLDFGFENSGNIFFIEKHLKFDVIKKENDNIYSISKYNNGFTWFKYVHQLQNLYFALTNKELTIK